MPASSPYSTELVLFAYHFDDISVTLYSMYSSQYRCHVSGLSSHVLVTCGQYYTASTQNTEDQEQDDRKQSHETNKSTMTKIEWFHSDSQSHSQTKKEIVS